MKPSPPFCDYCGRAYAVRWRDRDKDWARVRVWCVKCGRSAESELESEILRCSEGLYPTDADLASVAAAIDDAYRKALRSLY
jgi:hypothetical protein